MTSLCRLPTRPRFSKLDTWPGPSALLKMPPSTTTATWSPDPGTLLPVDKSSPVLKKHFPLARVERRLLDRQNLIAGSLIVRIRRSHSVQKRQQDFHRRRFQVCGAYAGPSGRTTQPPDRRPGKHRSRCPMRRPPPARLSPEPCGPPWADPENNPPRRIPGSWQEPEPRS